MRFFPHVPRELGVPWGFDNLTKENAQCVHHLTILPILESAVHGLSAKISSQVLCRVLFQAETLGRLDEALCPFDTPVGLFATKALSSQGPSVATPKGACSILVRLILHSRSPPNLADQKPDLYCNPWILKVKI
jgi:hypothetical protein